MTQPSHRHLGDFPLSTQKFGSLKELLNEFLSPSFRALHAHLKQNKVSQALSELIQKTPVPCFLLAAVIDYIDLVNQLKVMDVYSLAHFELWLNQFSHLSEEENYCIRAKIVGKQIPRSAYQNLFPIGMGKVFAGSHFVTAHASPDLDTTIASFWGWVDAFGARVSEGLHVWNVPGGPPLGQVEIPLLFDQLFGNALFSSVAKTRTTLSLSGIDLMTQEGFAKETTDASILEINHEGEKKAIVLVDSQGGYLGDWRDCDVEGVRQVISLFNHSLYSFSHTVQMGLFSLFSKEHPGPTDIAALLDRILLSTLGAPEPIKELTERQKQLVHDYLTKVLHVEKGLDATFQEFAEAMKSFSIFEFQSCIDLMKTMQEKLKSILDHRCPLFAYLQQVMKSLDKAFEKMRMAVEKLDVALQIKLKVFGHLPHFIHGRTDLEEIRVKMAQHPYLSVLSSDDGGTTIPLGIVRAQDVYKSILGTVTLRDFCNREETKIPSYLEVISVIDHHKSQLTTSSAPMVLISDAQSANVLCAELAFIINDQFSVSGMSSDKIETQIKDGIKHAQTPSQKRCLMRLLQKQCVQAETHGYFVDPVRERIEYLHFLYAILDDTDLLTKVSVRDLECVVQLINRLKTLCLKQEVEPLSLHDLPKDVSFLHNASVRILQHPDVYSLYQKVYAAKKLSVENNINKSASGENTLFFIDTKEQNGCARVGQAKLFPSNYPVFAQKASLLQKRWIQSAQDFFSVHAEIDLHIQMISTIAGAEEILAGSNKEYPHQDELWIWIPFTEASIEHLKAFLSAFASSIPINKSTFSAECYGEKGAEYAQLFSESFQPLASQVIDKTQEPSFVRLKHKAGLINSRKAMISPFLPGV